MAIEKIIQSIAEKQPVSSFSIIRKTFKFFKKQTKDLPFIDKRNLQNKAIERGSYLAKENARIEFICAAILFDLPKRDKNIFEKIQKELSEDIFLIVKSYDLARQYLSGKNESLFEHVYRTAFTLAKIKMSTAAICAALLHELPVLSQLSDKKIEKLTNKEVASLCTNFQKIRKIRTTNNQLYINKLREMTIAMAEDLQVIIIKMSSNIDRMKHQLISSKEKLRNVALESREILAPLADLLGIWQLRWQLEDYSFKILQPEEYEKINKRFNVDERKNRDKYIHKTKNHLEKTAKLAGINCHISGRFKHFNSIHRKMIVKKKSFYEIGDIFALRVVVDSIDDCYRMIGHIHRLWKPKQRRFKDYIADPKSNQYRSLHTTVIGINSRLTEFQIRTKEMNETANYGIAAHWYYKNPRKKSPEWIQELLIKQQQHKSDQDYLSKFHSEVLGNRIYIYTPKGDVISLPEGSTPIDFAYQIHTEVGHKCSEAFVNELPVPLNYILSTNDVIKIIVDRSQAGPKTEWLEFVKTPGAKKSIENYFNRPPMERNL